MADTQYRLYVNGRYAQSGPAPADCRWPEIDPVDIGQYLRAGENCLAVAVGYYGNMHNGGGDNQWLAGGSGCLILELNGDQSDRIASNGDWKCVVDCSRRPTARRSIARFLRERVDFRQALPSQWTTTDFDDSKWPLAVELNHGLPHPGCQSTWHPHPFGLKPRTIPLMKEEDIRPTGVIQWGRLDWCKDPELYFDALAQNACVLSSFDFKAGGMPKFPLTLNPGRESSVLMTFDFGAEAAAYPVIDVEANEGTVIDLIFHEKKLEPGPLWLDGVRNNVRVICRNGRNRFVGMDYEAVKYMQVVARNASGPIVVHEASARKRFYPFPHDPDLRTSDPVVNRVFSAAINTNRNVMQDYVMDNVRRERGGYMFRMDSVYYAFGDSALARRSYRNAVYSQCEDGWIFECGLGMLRVGAMPGVFMQLGGKQGGRCLIDATLAHLIFLADYYRYWGNDGFIKEICPAIAKYLKWLLDHRGKDGLLPLEPSMWHTTWLDHMGFTEHEQKIAPLNMLLYHVFNAAGPAIVSMQGEDGLSDQMKTAAGEIEAKLKADYLDPELGLYVDNRPDIRTKGYAPHTHELTLAFSLLSGLVPDSAANPSIGILADYPDPLPGSSFERTLNSKKIVVGITHPTNNIWRMLALGRYNQGAAIIRDVVQRWGQLVSIEENMTLPESWELKQDGTGLDFGVRCQCDMTIAETMYRCILGLEPRRPGWTTFAVNPQLGSLAWAQGTVWTPHGPIAVKMERVEAGQVKCKISRPKQCKPEFASHVVVENEDDK